MATDLERAYKVLRNKAKAYDVMFSYADGNQPLQYSTRRLQEAFRDLTATFSQNWVSVVLNSVLDRMQFTGWGHEDTSIAEALQAVYAENQLENESIETHKGALVTHESFIIAWLEEAGIEVYYNDPRMCHVFYKPDRPRVKEFAAKWWKDDGEGKYYMILYYPDRMEYYETKPLKQMPNSANAFKASEVAVAQNDYGVIPVFHFVVNKNTGISELTNIVSLQDAVNKLFADMMVAAEFGAFKQRWVITQADVGTLKNAPNQIWQLPPGETGVQGTQVGEFEATPLSNYLDAIDKITNAVAIISRTPKHYFMQTGANVSGEALLAMEAPLVAKVEQYENVFGNTWQELGAFISRLLGKQVSKEDITVLWQPAQSVQPKTEADTMKVLKEVGLPLEVILSWAGQDEGQIAEIMATVNKEKNAQATQAKLMLEKLRAQQAQDNAVVPEKDTLADETAE